MYQSGFGCISRFSNIFRSNMVIIWPECGPYLFKIISYKGFSDFNKFIDCKVSIISISFYCIVASESKTTIQFIDYIDYKVDKLYGLYWHILPESYLIRSCIAGFNMTKILHNKQVCKIW